MKDLVVLSDGMADEPLQELGGKTPLEVAKTPNLDRISKRSEIGMGMITGPTEQQLNHYLIVRY